LSVIVKEGAGESWPRYPYFCMTLHLLTGHMLDKLHYLNLDWKKLIIQHILLTWHQLITIYFQMWRNTSMDRDFPPFISSSTWPKSGWRSSQNFSFFLKTLSSL